MLPACAATEVELKEKKHRLEDAISATRAAIEEGIIPGGGSALVQAAAQLDDLGFTGDEATGVQIVRRALSAPARWIAENAGAEGGVIVARIAELPAGHGYNAATGEFGDLVAQGVLDPVKVTRSAVQNAASIAWMLLDDRGAGDGEAGARPARRRPVPDTATSTNAVSSSWSPRGWRLTAPASGLRGLRLRSPAGNSRASSGPSRRDPGDVCRSRDL